MTRIVIERFCQNIPEKKECERLVGELLSANTRDMDQTMQLLNKIARVTGKDPEKVAHEIMESCPLCE